MKPNSKTIFNGQGQLVKAALAVLLGFSSAVACLAQSASDSSLLKSHVDVLCNEFTYRNYRNLDELERTAQYIENQLKQHCDTVYRQTFFIQGKSYCNIIGKKFGNEKILVIGAHYDVCGDQQGADDNASGVAGLLELSRCIKPSPESPTLEFVAYTLEEPPYFRTEFMGSYLHAKQLSQSGVEVVGMISLEMIGYFSDQAHSQLYPLKSLGLIYGNKGNYITLVRKLGSSKFERRFSRKFKHSRKIRTKRFSAPVKMPGVDFSDHLNYWEMGIPALMITDTAFMRNFNYHTKGDVPERLDFERMTKVVDAAAIAILAM